MSAKQTNAKVIAIETIAENVIQMDVELSDRPAPGTFYMLRAWDNEPLLSRPISVGSSTAGTVRFYILVKGRGTARFSKLRAGDRIDCTGPLGNGFTLSEGKIALVGGGIGTAPLIGLSHALKSAPDVYLGFQDTPYAVDAFRSESIQIATESGKAGEKGFVTTLLDPSRYDVIYACGPTPMLAALQKQCAGKTTLYLSLEAHMACGVGACLGCTVLSKEGYLRVCKDGPVFLSTKVSL